MPLLVHRQGLGRDHRDDVIRGGLVAEIDGEIRVAEVGGSERGPPRDPGELGRAAGEEVPGVGEKKVEHTQPLDPITQLFHGPPERGRSPGGCRKSGPDPLEHPAERAFAVGRADGAVHPQGKLTCPLELPVVGEGPGAPPQLPRERMGILQADPPHVGLADVTDHDVALDRVAADQICDGRVNAGLGVPELSVALAFVERDPPAVPVGARTPAPLHQPREAEADVRGDVGAHSQKFAHGAHGSATSARGGDSRPEGLGPLSGVGTPRVQLGSHEWARAELRVVRAPGSESQLP